MCDPDAGGGVSQQRWGGSHPPFMFPSALFGFVVLDRPTRTAPAVRGETGATPPVSPLARHGEGRGLTPGLTPGITPLPRLRGGRSRLYVSLREGSPARTRAGR